MSILEVAILALATWRLASLIANEDGPFEIFALLRTFVGVRYTTVEKSQSPILPIPYGTNEFAKMLLCVWCNSIWIGAAVALAYWYNPHFTTWACLPLALSALAIVIDKQTS